MADNRLARLMLEERQRRERENEGWRARDGAPTGQRTEVDVVDRSLAPGFLFYYQGLFVGGPTRNQFYPMIRANMADWAGDRKDLLEGRA